jgi:SAM-dependent methyltransferase
MNVPHAVKQYTPDFVRKMRNHLRFMRTRQHFREIFRSVSIGDAFTEIYRTNAWGAVADHEFYSGSGSEPQFATSYANWVNHFVLEQAVHQIVDLGCGDFRVGRLLNTSGDVHYTGIDVVNDVVRYNREHFEDTNIKFQCANIIEDELPDGDLCLIRQVLQHLSNRQIARVLKACSKYCYVLVTEGVYAGPKARPNLDKPAGWDTRIHTRSGVFLDLPPFNLPVRRVLEVPEANSVVLRTTLLDNKKKALRG